MKDVIICIGRQYGSGGRFIGKLLAERLNVPCYDKELIGLGENKNDVKVVSNINDLSNTLVYSAVTTKASYGLPVNQQVFIKQFDTIKMLATKGSCVIIGRCADYVLQDTSNVISIFITAPIEDRIKRAISYYNIPEEKAQKQIKKIDKKRKDYYNFYTNKAWGEASNYDLSINSKIGVEKCVDVIVKYIESL